MLLYTIYSSQSIDLFVLSSEQAKHLGESMIHILQSNKPSALLVSIVGTVLSDMAVFVSFVLDILISRIFVILIVGKPSLSLSCISDHPAMIVYFRADNLLSIITVRSLPNNFFTICLKTVFLA